MDKLEELFPDQIIQLKEYRSFVNQPERIQISSQEDVNDYDPSTLTSYYNFRVRLPRPALNVKSIQLARASIPNCVTSFPDTETTFWFYALPYESAGNIYLNNGGVPGTQVYTFDVEGNLYTYPGGVPLPNDNSNTNKVFFDSGILAIENDVASPYDFNITTALTQDAPCIQGTTTYYFIEYTNPVLAPRRSNYLRYIRLVPSFTQPDLLDSFSGGYNRIFQDYDDLTNELNLSCQDDPLNGELVNETAGVFKFVANLISFSFSQRYQKIIFTGEDNRFVYLPAASDDPLWYAAAQELQQRDIQYNPYAFSGAIQIIQPYIAYRNLNLRLGFNYVNYPVGFNYENMFRPIPPYIATPPSNLGIFTPYDHMAPGYVDLVYTSCCHIYCDIVGSSTVDSIANKALLATVPINTSNLGVAYHSLPLNNPLTKISSQIFEIYIELRTDAGQPLYLGNNAIVSLEFILSY